MRSIKLSCLQVLWLALNFTLAFGYLRFAKPGALLCLHKKGQSLPSFLIPQHCNSPIISSFPAVRSLAFGVFLLPAAWLWDHREDTWVPCARKEELCWFGNWVYPPQIFICLNQGAPPSASGVAFLEERRDNALGDW